MRNGELKNLPHMYQQQYVDVIRKKKIPDKKSKNLELNHLTPSTMRISECDRQEPSKVRELPGSFPSYCIKIISHRNKIKHFKGEHQSKYK